MVLTGTSTALAAGCLSARLDSGCSLGESFQVRGDSKEFAERGRSSSGIPWRVLPLYDCHGDLGKVQLNQLVVQRLLILLGLLSCFWRLWNLRCPLSHGMLFVSRVNSISWAWVYCPASIPDTQDYLA